MKINSLKIQFKQFFVFLIICTILVWLAVFQLPDNQLHLVFCNVGQGDAALITYKNQQILIDGGPDSRVLNCLSEHLPFWDRKIEAVIETHPEADHLTGLIDVIERYSIKYFLLNSNAKDSADFKTFRQAVNQEKAIINFPQQGDRVKIGPVSLSFLWPEKQDKILGATTIKNEVNDTGLVTQLDFGNFDVLFTCDVTSKIEDSLAWPDQFSIDGQLEVLKVAHHGSKYSSSEQFLEKIKPALAVISVGRNSFGHPTKEVLDRLQNLGIKTLRTDQDGEVEIVSDGKSWRVVDKK